MKAFSDQHFRGRVVPGAFLAGFAVLATAGVWATGVPGSDPVGGLFHALRDGAGNYADWAREGPVDGHPDWTQNFRPVAGGDPERGLSFIREHGCGACHIIPGLAGAHGTVGPGLAGFADRAYLAGGLTNRAERLVDFLLDPASLAPETAMPDTGLSRSEAADAAAYLYTLSDRR